MCLTVIFTTNEYSQEIAEEHDALIQEKNQVEEDLVKMESKLQEILQALEVEARPLLNGHANSSQVCYKERLLLRKKPKRCALKLFPPPQDD